MSDTTTGYRRILGLTWPIILANSATPLLGLVDTAIIGNLAGTAHLGAIALGDVVAVLFAPGTVSARSRTIAAHR